MRPELLLTALRQWKCPGCGGTGRYEQNIAGRRRAEAHGRAPDPAFSPGPVICKVCGGDGLHPIASEAITAAGGRI